jgi:hypothetical protein
LLATIDLNEASNLFDNSAAFILFVDILDPIR